MLTYFIFWNIMTVYAIAAIEQARGLGLAGKLAWHYPEDLKMFKSLSFGHGLVMGRKTFESLPGVLPGRGHYIVSRQLDLKLKVPVYSNIEQAIHASNLQHEHTFVIGGAEIFVQALDLVEVIYLTRINKSYPSDVFLPELPETFILDSSQVITDELRFEVYIRD